MGIVETISWNEIFNCYSGAVFHSSPSRNGPTVMNWYNDPNGRWEIGGKKLPVAKVLRPRNCETWATACAAPHVPDVALAHWIRDPLFVDLDGGGIKTVGLNAGIHFDHDANGLKELSGWVGPGDGVLMLDRNGNGRLDNGGELFGNSTILPNGARAANGFQALAYYDANCDGKIDAHDPVWSQLRIWQHADALDFWGVMGIDAPPQGGG
jgi:hypothetical protein